MATDEKPNQVRPRRTRRKWHLSPKSTVIYPAKGQHRGGNAPDRYQGRGDGIIDTTQWQRRMQAGQLDIKTVAAPVISSPARLRVK
ncbi:hypothetical protein N7461_006845 [Penicillium sp. DV-2018c]|nr:hypothetical protein N7461_006845 [Penicillium sp. DV-2018c]